MCVIYIVSGKALKCVPSESNNISNLFPRCLAETCAVEKALAVLKQRGVQGVCCIIYAPLTKFMMLLDGHAFVPMSPFSSCGSLLHFNGYVKQ